MVENQRSIYSCAIRQWSLDNQCKIPKIWKMVQTFLKLISEYKCVKYLFIGYVHRPTTGTVCGVPFATMRSILY